MDYRYLNKIKKEVKKIVRICVINIFFKKLLKKIKEFPGSLLCQNHIKIERLFAPYAT